MQANDTTKPAAKLSKRAQRKADKAAKAAQPTTDATATATAPAPAANIGGFTLGNIARTARTVAAQRTHFGAESDRDNAYMRLYLDCANDAERLARFGVTPDGRTVTLAALASYTLNPFYTGSAKPHDAGAINRAIKAGHLSRDETGSVLTLTERGLSVARAIQSAANKRLPVPTEPASEPASE